MPDPAPAPAFTPPKYRYEVDDVGVVRFWKNEDHPGPQWIGPTEVCHALADRDSLSAEVARLREALELVTHDAVKVEYEGDVPPVYELSETTIEAARSALAGRGPITTKITTP